MRSLSFALIAALAVSPANAQERETRIDRAGLPRDVAREATRLFNETATLRSTGRVEIEEGRVVEGDVAVLDGPVLISGRVRGRVLAINGDVVLRPTARIDGDLLVVGGEVEGRHTAYIGGEIRIYRQQLQYTREGDLIYPERTSVASEETVWWRRWERTPRRTGTKLQIASAGAYNRVEGLPINLGPQAYFNHDKGSARLDAFAVLRTGTSFGSDRDDIGHNVNLELRLGRRGGPLIGGRIYNLVEPTEAWQLTDLEAGLSAFVLRKDYRDYFDRKGASVRAGAFVRNGADVSVSYAHEAWGTRPLENPWTLLRSGMDWRPNPVFDEGTAHLLNTTLRVDTRNDSSNPWSGWFVLADLENGWANITAYAPRSSPVGLPSGPRVQYTRGFLDLRRYNRISPDAQVNFRLVTGGWMSGDPLPLQRRFALDGPGSMPGYDFRAPSSLNTLICTSGAYVMGIPGQCDRMVLGQIEYRGDLHIDLFTDWEEDHYMRRHSDGVWVFFADAGRGWLVGPATGDGLTYQSDAFPSLRTFRSNLGFGLDFDIIGLYLAKSTSQPKEPANFFVRVRHRF
jgi:hypothetical protein